jgi:SAM-dependent methyltransferase
VTFLDLGRTPVANALLSSPDEPAPEYPLAVGVCRDCTLAQLMFALPADALFDSDYPYYSSYSDALDEHSRRHCDDLAAAGRTGEGRFVVEVASNDGYLLRHLLSSGTRVLGIEPTPGPAAVAVERGIPTLVEFLDPEVAARVRAEHGPADLVLANNVMAHVPDLPGFVDGMVGLLADDGVLQVENPGLRWLIEHVEFDTVYHEHYCYFSSTAVDRLVRRHGLVLNDVEFFPDLQGGTLRWTCSRSPHVSERAQRHLREEQEIGLDRVENYVTFGARVTRLQDDLRALLGDLKQQGKTIAAYGAAAKGATLLNTTGIDASTIDFVVDRNPHKQGTWLPGARLPILPPEALLERQPDYVLVLAWNYVDEVRRQQEEYERRGGRFILPVPSVRVL